MTTLAGDFPPKMLEPSYNPGMKKVLGRAALAVVLVVVAAAILFPVFAQPFHPPNAIAYGPDGEPLVGREFRVRFANGT